MSGLGAVQKNNGIYLSIAGGFIWDRKKDKTDPHFATQKYTRADKTEGVREGAQYADLTGKVVFVEFKTHDEYGDSVNVTVEAGGENYILSVSTNNRYSQDLMKALLKMDFEKEIFIKPYDFVDKEGKRAQGVLFKQNGQKIVLRNDDAPSRDSEWFKTATKKEIRRFFEDLAEWFVAEIEEKICPKFKDRPVGTKKAKPGLGAAIDEVSQETNDDDNDTPEKPEQKRVTPLKMKQALKAYIKENYEGKELPKLKKEELEIWYNLSQETEDLPWPKNSDSQSGSVLDAQLDALIPNK